MAEKEGQAKRKTMRREMMGDDRYVIRDGEQVSHIDRKWITADSSQ